MMLYDTAATRNMSQMHNKVGEKDGRPSLKELARFMSMRAQGRARHESKCGGCTPDRSPSSFGRYEVDHEV